MNKNIEEQAEIRSYLLGILSDEAKTRQIEEKLLIDDRFSEELLVAEGALIEEYLDGTLDESQRERFDQFFLSTPQRRQQLRLTQHFRRYAAKAGTKTAKKMNFASVFRSMFSSPLPAAAAVAAVLLISFFAWLIFIRSSETQRITAHLNNAYKFQRPFESRLSDLAHAPLGETRGENKSRIDQRELDEAENISREAARRQETAESLYNEGRVFLVKGEFGRAIETLEKAKNLDPNNARIANNLGVAQLEQAKSLSEDPEGKDWELKTKALENFEKAFELDPKLLDAYFNRALCLQALPLPGKAREAWEEYLNRDPASPWADEAKRNLELIGSEESQNTTADRVLQDFMAAYREKDHEKAYRLISRNREMITGKLVPQRLAFLFLTTAEGAEKREFLSALNYAGGLEKERSNDPYFYEIANFYSRASKEKQEILKNAHDAVRKGYKLCESTNYREALENFKRARELFEQAGDDWEARLCDYWIAYCDYQLSYIRESTDRYSLVEDFGDKKNYKWLLAQTYYGLSVNENSSRNSSKSLNYAEMSLKFSQETFDFYNTPKAYASLAKSQIDVKKYPEALANMAKTMLVISEPEYSLRQKWRDYNLLAQLFYGMKLYAAAEAFETEAFNLNKDQINDTTFERVSLGNLSRIYGSRKKYEEALAFAEKGREAAEKLPNPENRRKGIGFALLQTAAMQLEKGDIQESLDNYNRAIDLYSSMEYKHYQYEAEKGRLLCYLAGKNDEAAQRVMPEVLRLFEANRDKILEEQNRASFFDEEQNVNDLAVGYEYDKGNHERAFEYAENSRSRSLLDWQKNPGKIDLKGGVPQIVYGEKTVSQPLSLNDIRARLPEQAQLIYYAVLPDKVVIWLIAQDRFETFSYDISDEELTGKVVSFVNAIKDQDQKTQSELSRSLYRILFSPVEASLDPRKEIFLIPDKILYHLSFAALISDKTENYLVADHLFSSSPSANVFLVSSENAVKRKQTDPDEEELLSVGDPAFDKREFPGLVPLPWAGKEAHDIAGLYSQSNVLPGPDATKQNIKEGLEKADVVQFAGHYITNEQSFLLSSFAVAGKGKDSRWTNYELLEGKLDRPRLLVLSACKTGVEHYYKGEGMIGAGRTFLALGVPLVVASQWEVDPYATAQLMKKFHRLRKTEKLSTVSALQRAQLEMMNHPDPAFRRPYYWAGFITLGGYAQF